MLQRIMNIAFRPNEEWPVVAAEAISAQTLFVKYVIPLAAIGPIAGVLGMMLFGKSMGGTWMWSSSMESYLTLFLISYVFAVIGVGVNALIVQKLAPTFKSQGDFVSALKMVVFSNAPFWLASVLTLVPILGMLTVLVGLYGIFLFYTGLPHVMKTPEDQRLPFMGIAFLVAVVIWWVLTAVPGFIMGRMWMNG